MGSRSLLAHHPNPSKLQTTPPMTLCRHDGRRMASTKQPEPFNPSRGRYGNPFVPPKSTIKHTTLLIISQIFADSHRKKRTMGACATRQQQQSVWRVESMVEIVGTTTPSSTLSFTMIGDPSVQRRMRIAWRGLFRGWRSHGNSARSTAYLNTTPQPLTRPPTALR